MNLKQIGKHERKQQAESIIGISSAEFNKLSPAEQRKFLKNRFDSKKKTEKEKN